MTTEKLNMTTPNSKQEHAKSKQDQEEKTKHDNRETKQGHTKN